MPIHTGQDSNGSFYQWGKTGKKYYYQSGNEESRKKALSKAKKQQTAIYSSGWKGDSMKLIKVKKNDSAYQKFIKQVQDINAKVDLLISERDKIIGAMSKKEVEYASRECRKLLDKCKDLLYLSD